VAASPRLPLSAGRTGAFEMGLEEAGNYLRRACSALAAMAPLVMHSYA
jgi:hypothetical protein